jgi:phospholipid transport system substrate-binding protein
MNLPMFRLARVLALGFLVLSTAPAAADVSQDAQTFVSDNGDRMIAILDEPAGAERSEHFYNWLREVFALDKLAELALGPYRQNASDEQLAEYNQAFADYIVTTYLTRFDAFTGYSFEVGQAKPMNNNDVAVRTTITDQSGKPIIVDFRVRPTGGSFQVIDVVVEGLSMLKTQRDEFSAVIQRKGLDGLIASLQESSLGQ